jgi:hypothetical protein
MDRWIGGGWIGIGTGGCDEILEIDPDEEGSLLYCCWRLLSISIF